MTCDIVILPNRGTDAKTRAVPFLVHEKRPRRRFCKDIAMKYKESDPFYHSAKWKSLRRAALDRDGGMCCDCMDLFRAGLMKKPRRATMVHHVKSREEYPELALDLSNLRSLCDTCHNRRHPEKGRRAEKPACGRMRVIKI